MSMFDEIESDEFLGSSTVSVYRGVAGDRSWPVLKKVIEHRVNGGEHLLVAGAIRGKGGYHKGGGWYFADVVGALSGAPKGRRWLRQKVEGGWEVRAEDPGAGQ